MLGIFVRCTDNLIKNLKEKAKQSDTTFNSAVYVCLQFYVLVKNVLLNQLLHKSLIQDFKLA